MGTLGRTLILCSGCPEEITQRDHRKGKGKNTESTTTKQLTSCQGEASEETALLTA